ncbi:hypothetical protein [Priestia filamentosa]|nr:hypothetical protein [Priestia filamentosa]
MPIYTTIDQDTCIAYGTTASDMYDYNDEGITFTLIYKKKGRKLCLYMHF